MDHTLGTPAFSYIEIIYPLVYVALLLAGEVKKKCVGKCILYSKAYKSQSMNKLKLKQCSLPKGG